MFWGLTPALDLLEEYMEHTDVSTAPTKLSILLIGGADCRHVLKTLARRYRHGKNNIQLNFYITDASMELVAKQLLLLKVALEENVAIVKKTRSFMELYGNTLVRPAVAKYLASQSQHLLKMITDYDYMKSVLGFVSMEIKYKERDYLENLVKFWCGRDAFDINDCWDRRLRKSLGGRYDSKEGVFDWDLHMRFHSIGGQQVCTQEYKQFRNTGVAFTWLESDVSKVNRSMVCVVVPNGANFAHYGYLGDMETGPFVAFGLECEDSDFLKSQHGQHAHRATDVTERNLAQIFHELQYQNEYEHRKTHDLELGYSLMQSCEKRVVDFTSENASKVEHKCFTVKNCQVRFLSMSTLKLMQHKDEYRDLFDVVYVGACYLRHLSKELLQCATARNALFLVENKKYVLHLRDKQLEEHRDEIKAFMEGIECKEIAFDVKQDDYAKYILLTHK